MYKNENGMDRRIVRSKKALKDALISLMEQKDFKEISVSDLVRLAEVNRGTFYKHYQYKEDILSEISDEVIQDLIASYRDPYWDRETFEVNKLNASAVKVFDHVSHYAQFYSLILKSEALFGFIHRMSLVLKQLSREDLDVELNESQYTTKIDRELHINYHVYALLGMIIEWINSGFKYSPHYMAEQLLAIVNSSASNSVFKHKRG